LEYFKEKHKIGYHVVHRWNVLKEAAKWRLGYVAYMSNVKNGTTGVTMPVNGEDEPPGWNVFPSCPRGTSPPRLVSSARLQPLL
jgi:hypothetical protein